MSALFAYLIAVALLLGGGYGALNWFATPEPVKVVATAKPEPPPQHYADATGANSTQPMAPQASLSEAARPEVTSKPEVKGSDQVKTASNDKAVSSDQPAAAGRQDSKAEDSAPAQEQNRSSQAEKPPVVTDQEARQHADAPSAEAKQNEPALSKREEKQSTQAVSPGNAQIVASIAPASAAKTPRRPYIRQAIRRSEKRPLEMMTLRTVELPDGRRMTQLVPYRGGDRYRGDGRAMAFEPDE